MFAKLIQSVQKHPIMWFVLVVVSISVQQIVWKVFFWGAAIWGFNSDSDSVLYFGHHIDASSYIRASLELPMYLKGEVDVQRTPVYPAFLAACRLFAGERYYLYLAVILQYLISFFAVYVFYKICKLLFTVNSAVILATIAFIGFRFVTEDKNNYILTESLSVSFIVFFFYGTASYVYKPAHWKAAALGLSAFILIMLRPAFLPIIPLLMLFWGLLFFLFRKQNKNSKTLLTGFSATVISFLLVCVYCYGVYQKSGVFTVTIIGPHNYLFCCIQSGVFVNGTDPVINDRIKELIDQWKENNGNTELHYSGLWSFEDCTHWENPLGYIVNNYPLLPVMGGHYQYFADTVDDSSIVNENDIVGYGLYGDEIISEAAMLRSTKKIFPIEKMNDYAASTIKRNLPAYICYVFRSIYFNITLFPAYWITVWVGFFSSLLVFCLTFYHPNRNQTVLYGFIILFMAAMLFLVWVSSYSDRCYIRLVLPLAPAWILSVFLMFERLQLKSGTWNAVENKRHQERDVERSGK